MNKPTAEFKNSIFVSAIIVSAGASSRMCGINKQFLELNGMPVIAHTIKAFQDSAYIDEIVVVTRSEDIDKIKTLVKHYSFVKVKAVVEGGSTRQRSVLNGVMASSLNADFLAIHDGARPFVTDKVICDTLISAVEFDAATTGTRVIDTVKVVDENDEIISTPDRNVLRAVQTPQIFNKSVYMDAVKSVPNSANFTDDCKLIEAYGRIVKIVDGDYNNIKITTPNDIKLAEFLIMGKDEQND